MSKAQFQQMKSTEAMHIKPPHGIWFNKGASTLFSQYRPSPDPDPNPRGGGQLPNPKSAIQR